MFYWRIGGGEGEAGKSEDHLFDVRPNKTLSLECDRRFE